MPSSRIRAWSMLAISLIHRRHHPIGELQQGDIQLALVQRLHHLQPDEAASTTVTWRG